MRQLNEEDEKSLWRNETILITGAARRLGHALAWALADRGAALILHCNASETEGRRLVAELRERTRSVALICADLSLPSGQDHLIEETLALDGRLSGLVNNASNYLKTPLGQLDRRTWDETVAVNLTAPLWLGAKLGAAMKKNGGGSIVMVGDWSTRRPYRDYLAYSVSKGGLETGTRALARELAPEVRVNLLAPGAILLPPESGDEYENRVKKAVPLGRLGGSSAYVETILYLLRGASYCTGAVLTMDGGRELS